MDQYNAMEEFYDLIQMEIRKQELAWWPEIATNPEYIKVTLEQVDAYYDEHRDEILDSLWPEMPERSEVISILAHENNADLFLDSPATHNQEQEQENGMVMG